MVFELGPQFLKLEGPNLEQLKSLATKIGGDIILKKVRGAAAHGGGVQLTPDAEYYDLLQEFLAPYMQEPDPAAAIKTPTLEPRENTFRRASLLLTGAIPSSLPSLKSNEELDTALSTLFDGDGFYDFIKRGANDRLLTRSINISYSLDFYLTHYYPMYSATVNAGGAVADFQKAVRRELGEAPLELISHVVRTNRPYTEILTADYAMVSKQTAIIFEANVSPQQDEFLPAKDEGQMVSGTVNPAPSGNWEMAHKAFAEPVGILSSPGFLQQYQTNATNRNRARARWTYQHFLGIDIENSSSRNVDASVLIDVQGGIPTRPACKVCHDRIDPVAGAFQRYGARGMYLDGPFGLDTLDSAYKRTAFYKPDDTWYRSMLAPGFEGDAFNLVEGSADQDPLRLLAEQITAHPKFAEGTIKFWWPAIFGEELLSYQLDDGRLSARQEWLNNAAKGFINSGYNLKDMLKSAILSPFFRSEVSADSAYKTGRRLLTPEELHKKTRSLTQYDDSRFTKDWQFLYGGIDSYNIEQRQRAFSTMMYQAVKLHAMDASCTLIDTLNKTQLTARAAHQSKVTIAQNTPFILTSDTQTEYQQLHLKNDQVGPVSLNVKFIPLEGQAEESAVSLAGIKSYWLSKLQTQKGNWEITTASTSAIKLQIALITRDQNQEISEFSKLAFNFWGDSGTEAVQPLYEFFQGIQNSIEPNLTEGCISIQGMPAWQVSELARWRLTYIRLMTDYKYLYE